MKNFYKQIEDETKLKGSVDFQVKGNKFRTFIDWEKDFCLTYYSKSGDNAWCVQNADGLEHKLNKIINQ